MATSVREAATKVLPPVIRGPSRVFSPLSHAIATEPLAWRRSAAAFSIFALLVADVAAFLIAAIATAYARAFFFSAPVEYPWGMLHPWNLWCGGITWMVMRANASLYNGHGIAPPEELRRAVQTSIMGAAVHGSMLFAFSATSASVGLAIGTWTLIIPLSFVLRELGRSWLLRRGLYGRPVVIAGAGDTGALVIRELRATPEIGLTPVAMLDDDPAKHGMRVEGVPVLGPIDLALDRPFPYKVDQVIVAAPSLSNRQTTRVLETLSRRFPIVTVIPGLVGLGSLNVRARTFGMFAGIELGDRSRTITHRGIKRAVDLALGVPLFVVSVPIVAVSAMIVKLVSPGAGLYSQEREGYGGRRIRVWKIRTMVMDAERRLEEHLASCEKASEEWSRSMKLRNDPRIVPIVGRFLRKTSLDELPQLWNVLRGDLSLVGPRPFPHYHLEKFSAEFRHLRRGVTPGMTGLWQVANRSDGDLAVQQAADSFYIQNRSFWLDFWILARTVKVVVRGTGAY